MITITYQYRPRRVILQHLILWPHKKGVLLPFVTPTKGQIIAASVTILACCLQAPSWPCQLSATGKTLKTFPGQKVKPVEQDSNIWLGFKKKSTIPSENSYCATLRQNLSVIGSNVFLCQSLAMSSPGQEAVYGVPPTC